MQTVKKQKSIKKSKITFFSCRLRLGYQRFRIVSVIIYKWISKEYFQLTISNQNFVIYPIININSNAGIIKKIKKRFYNKNRFIKDTFYKT